MSEPDAMFWAVATAGPAIVALSLYFFWFARLARRLRLAHPAVWEGLGRPTLAALVTLRTGWSLIAWVARQGYVRVGSSETAALGLTCRRVYFAMIGVVIWVLAVTVSGPVSMQ